MIRFGGRRLACSWLIPAAVLFGAAVAPAACTKYTVAPDDGSSGAAGAGGGNAGGMTTAAGGRGGAAAGGAGGTTRDAALDMAVDTAVVTADAAVDRIDAPAVDVPRVDAGNDALPDTGPPLLANGASCQVGTECQFGKCIDGVCCESSCGGQCQSCAEPTLLGKCVTVSASVRGIVRPACGGTGTCASTCNGSDPAQCHYPGTEKQCVAASCTGGVAKVASTCNGNAPAR